MKIEIALEEKAKGLLEFIDYYKICNKAEDKSPKTISWYNANLKSFHNYLQSRHLPDTLDKIDIRLHAHLCRHTFATKFLINGDEMFTLQQILGHSTLEMVGRYVNLASSHVAIQHQKFSPLDRLNIMKL